MADGDRQSTISNGPPRLAEISRVVARGIRGLAEVAGAPSFADSLASASATVDGDAPALGAAPADDEVMSGGRKTGDAILLRPHPRAQVNRDRAVGTPGAPARFTALLPQARTLPTNPGLPSTPPAPASTTPTSTPTVGVPPTTSLPPATPMLPAVAAAPASQPPAPSAPNTSVASFPQSASPATGAGPTAFPQASALPPAYSTPIASAQGTAYAALPGAATSAAPDQSAAAVSSGVSPSLTAAARSTSSLVSASAGSNGAAGPGLALEEYPKPARSDRSGVLSWTSAAPPTGRELDRLVAEARERRVGWVTFVADPDRMDEYGELADRLTRAGIQPIARIEDPAGDLPVDDVKALVKELRGHGVRYFQLFDDANVAEQTPDYRVDVQDYAQRWLAAAKAVVAGGGLPGIGALSHDGDYDDLGFMRQLLSAVKEKGGTDVMGQSWLALRGETPGAAATKSDVGDLAGRAGWFDRVSRQALGRSLPILATLDPAGRPEQLSPEPSVPSVSAPVEQAEQALRDLRRKLPALFGASRGTLEASRA